jgi:putative endonuclease
MPEHEYYVYILANTFHRLYTGVTNDLRTRVAQHKSAANPNSFTARYGIDRLVHFERFQFVEDAIARETQIKGWLRIKKIALIVQHNPTWRDLSEAWGKTIPSFREEDLQPPTTF